LIGALLQVTCEKSWTDYNTDKYHKVTDMETLAHVQH